MSARASAWRDYRRIWTAAVTWRNPAAVEWGGRIALLLALAAGMARLAGVLEYGVFWRMELGIFIGWFAMLWITLFLPASVLMNSAPNARLVPRLRRRLLQMNGAGCLLLMVGMSLMFRSWSAFPLFAAYLLGVLLNRAGVRSGVVPIVLSVTWPQASQSMPPALLHAITAPASLLAESALLLACTAWSLLRLYPDGGDRHLDGRARVVDSIRRFESGHAQGGRDTPWFMRWSYAAALRRACRRRNPATLLMHALGPGAHWGAWLALLAIVAALGVVMRLFLDVADGAAQHWMMDWVTGFDSAMMAMTVAFSSATFAQQLRRTRGEQALLRLTPLAGDPAQLNRRLAAGMIKAALVNWGLLSCVFLGMAWVFSTPGRVLLCQFALCCLGGQFAMTGLLGNHAHSVARIGWRWWLRVALQAACSVALALGLSRLGGVFWAWLALVAVAGWVAVVMHARRRMLGAPPAYPVERLE